MWWTRGGRKQLLDRLQALEEGQETLESRLRLLKNEWEDVLDHTNRVMGRLNARIRKNQAIEGPEVDSNETQVAPAPPQGVHSILQEARARHGLLPR